MPTRKKLLINNNNNNNNNVQDKIARSFVTEAAARGVKFLFNKVADLLHLIEIIIHLRRSLLPARKKVTRGKTEILFSFM